jgi:agmatinase
MNPAKSYGHLFSPQGGDLADNYRAPGQITFLRSEHVPLNADALRKSGVRFAFIGIPFDEGNIGKPGSEEGPREFRLASQEYFPYWFEYQVDLQGCAVDCGDVQMPKVNPNLARERIYHAVREVLAAGLTPIICGGDRSVSIPVATAVSDHFSSPKKIGTLHFGAQLDLADSWAGEHMLSTCAFARVTELPNIKVEHIAHVGARNSLNPKDWIDLAKERGLRYFPMMELLDRGVTTVVGEAIRRVWDGTDAQYLSFNFNVMDASAAPGVTSAEPGGLEAREMIRIADMIGKEGKVSAIEITELCPIFDVSGTTSRLAVCVVLRIMAAMARARGETVNQSIRRSQRA